ncbi:MAG: SemiSWEET transporter [Proteobacteria bacterium]|nr:SemiSWEET transporter [Pseudomonadota bacterium]
MPQYLVEIIGGLAATITTLGYIPQAVKAIRTRDTASISLAMYVLLAIGIALWLVYGILITSWPLIGANIVTLVTILITLAMKIRHG